MKYRIIKTEIETGEAFYTPQRRVLGIWCSFTELLQGGAMRIISFDNRMKAIEFIENYKKSKKRKKTIVYRDKD